MTKHADEKSDGSFMRIQVISLLKLAVVSFVATSAFVLFIIVGFAGAPEVSLSDIANAEDLCGNDFNMDHFAQCSVKYNVTLPAMTLLDNSNATVSGPLMSLSSTDRVNVVTCMLEHCLEDTNRTNEVDDQMVGGESEGGSADEDTTGEVTTSDEDDTTAENDTADNSTLVTFAHYSVSITGMTQRNRYFYLDVAFPNDDPAAEDHTFNVSLLTHIRGYYFNSTTGNQSYVDMIPTDELELLTIWCEKGELFCDPQYLLHFGDISYTDYDINLLFNSTIPLPLNGSDPLFTQTWGTREFTNWMIGIKYFFLLVSIIWVIWYTRQLNMLSMREQNLEQGWVVALCVALVLFNDPFYYAEAEYGGDSFKVLSVMFQVTFFQMLLLFWLIALDNMRLQGIENGISNAAFFMPKITFIVLFWFLTLLYHGYIKYYGDNYVIWELFEESETLTFLQTSCGLCTLVYLFCFITLVIRSRNEFRSKKPRYKYLLVLSVLVVILSLFGFSWGSFSPAPETGGEWTLYQALFNIYIYTLSYLFAPSATTLKHAQERAMEHGGQDNHPEQSPLTVEVAEVDIENLELA